MFRTAVGIAALASLAHTDEAAPLHPSGEAATASTLMVDGLGTSALKPDTEDPRARAWFAQGERLVWAFDEAEAVRAFREAQRIDATCALCFWGEAWARKPTINLRVRYKEMPTAREAALKAHVLSNGLEERQKLLVEAMEAATRGPIFASKIYADLLEAAAKQDPNDELLGVLAAEARMSASDWRSFDQGSLTQELLERALRTRPDHSGAIHLYIHLTDWLDRPDLAEPHADRLAGIAPAASHLRHMSSHAYFGVGRFADAVQANRAAIEAHKAFEAVARPITSPSRNHLLGHSLYFGVMSALADGDGAAAREFLDGLKSPEFNESHSSMQHRMRIIAEAYVTALYSTPGEVLAARLPDSRFGKIARHYARGEAHTRLGDPQAIEHEANSIANLRHGAVLAPFSAGEARLAEIYEHVLLGHAAMLRKDHDSAVRAYGRAVEAQNGVQTGYDPPDFWYSTRRSLAAALLESGRSAEAALEAERSLLEWPGDSAARAVLRCAERALAQH